MPSHQPHLSLLYGTARWGPTSRVGLGVPDQDASQGPSWPLGQLVEINPTFSPLISSYSFNFISLYISLFIFIFHHRLMHRAASSSRSVADRFNSYNTRLCSETDPLTLGPLLSGKHRLYHKPMSTVCSLYTLGSKPLISGSSNIFCHLCSQCISIMIPDFLLHNV